MSYGKGYKVDTGSATPKAPTSTNPGTAVGGKGPSYNPSAAASCLREQGTEGSAPSNKGPMGG